VSMYIDTDTCLLPKKIKLFKMEPQKTEFLYTRCICCFVVLKVNFTIFILENLRGNSFFIYSKFCFSIFLNTQDQNLHFGTKMCIQNVGS
jgi:hypothetical protein